MTEEEQIQKPSLLGMITKPGEQFDRIREIPLIWGAMFVVIILHLVGTWLTTIGLDIVDYIEMTEGIVVSDEMVGILNAIVPVVIVMIAVIAPLVSVLIATVIHLLVSKIASITVTFKQLFSMNTYIMLISSLGVIIMGVIFASVGGNLDPEQFSLSIGSIINAEGALGIFLSRLELFTIWTLILTAIGLQKVAGFSKGLAWAVTLIFPFVGLIFAMAGA